MFDRKPALSAAKTPVNTGVLLQSAPSKKAGAPSIRYLDYEVEEPNAKTVEMQVIKCCNSNGDITKRWYVDYYIPHPLTGKPKRTRDYGFVNKEKDPDKRMSLLLDLKSRIINSLELKNAATIHYDLVERDSITFYINDFLREKAKVLEPKTLKSYNGFLIRFHAFLKIKMLSHLPPINVTKQIAIAYRNDLANSLTNRSVNNNFDCIKGFFTYLINNYDNVLIKNPCETIKKLDSKSEKNVAFTVSQAISISKYLEENDPFLLRYCRFVALGFLRCKEVRFLKIGDFDFQRRTITLPVKNIKSKKRTVKPMLDVLCNLVTDLEHYAPENYVFGHGDKPGLKHFSESYFAKRFKPVKVIFSLTDKHTIYGLRHTFISDLLDSGANWHEIMKYTGHTTFAAFEKYARSILNRPAIDLSANISIKF